MNKLNLLGAEILEIKEEVDKIQPEIIQKALFKYIDELRSANSIDDTIYIILKDRKLPKDDIEKVLYTNKLFLKSETELLEEFEKLRLNLNKALNIEEAIEADYSNFTTKIETFNKIDTDEILYVIRYNVKNEFISSLFNITSEAKKSEIFQRKGFVEMYSILRYTAIFNEFICLQENSEIKENSSVIIEYSDIFKDSITDRYGIQLIFKVPVEKIENNDINKIAEEISSLSEASIDFFKEKIKY